MYSLKQVEFILEGRMGSTYAAAAFALNLRHRILPLQWFQRNGVTRFSHNTHASASSLHISPHPGVNRRKSLKGVGVVDSNRIDAQVPKAEGTLPHTLPASKYGAVLNQWDGCGKEVTDTEHAKVCEQVVDCMTTGEVVAHESLTHGSDGLSEGDIILNQELSNDGVVDEEYMEAPDEVFEDVSLNNRNVKGRPERTRQGAEKLAVELLAKRAFTAVELRKKLTAKFFPLNIVEAVLRDFQDRGLINDGLYAETFSHSRWESSSWGPRRIKQALSKKGVGEREVEKAVKMVFEDGSESESESESEGRSRVRVSSGSVEKLYVEALKQWERSRNVGEERRKARVRRWLEYRGFDWGVIGGIMKRLECGSREA